MATTVGENNSLELVPVAVVMVPLPLQGHLNPLLHLSRLISTYYHIPVHFATISTAVERAKARIHGWKLTETTNIHFHEFPTPAASINPNPNHSPKNKFLSEILPHFKALMTLREPAYALAKMLSATARKIVVVYDYMMAYVVQDIRFLQNAESFCFHGASAFTHYAISWEIAGKPSVVENEAAERALKQVPSIFDGCFAPEFEEISSVIDDVPKFHSGVLYNTSRVIEGMYMDLFAKERKLWAMGPFNPVSIVEDSGRRKCLDWLDKQKAGSVVFVSFGTTCSLSDEQVEELALGLERSKYKFIWVLRDDEGVDGSASRNISLPDGYEERVVLVRGQWLILRDWAPQLDILGHPSTGAFISHCGWNSCIESISNGVPMGTWPMHSDQPGNAVLITKVLKIGTEVRDWAQRDRVLSSVAVGNAILKLMASSEGEAMRKTASELGDAVKKSVMKGGVSRMELDSFIAYVSR